MVEEMKKLYVPYGLKNEKAYFSGIYKKQMSQLIVGGIGSLLIAISLWFLSNPAIAIIVGVFLAFATFMLVRKDSNMNLSFVDQVCILYHWSKVQKKYKYVYSDDWTIPKR